MNKLKEFFSHDTTTTICGLVAIVFSGLALLIGKATFEQFLYAVGTIAAGWGLIRAKDSDKE